MNVFDEHLLSTTTLPHVNERYHWSLPSHQLLLSSPDPDCPTPPIPTDRKTQPAIPLKSRRLASWYDTSSVTPSQAHSYHDPACVYDFPAQLSRALKNALVGYLHVLWHPQ